MQYITYNKLSDKFQILIEKIAILMLFETFFGIILSFLEAEIFRFFMLQLATSTLYDVFAAFLPLSDKTQVSRGYFDLYRSKSLILSASATF